MCIRIACGISGAYCCRSMPVAAARSLKAITSPQNEVFVNLTGRSDLNGQWFDQNRAYVAFGRRLSAKLDFVVGYLNQFINGRSSDTLNHVIQFALYTRR